MLRRLLAIVPSFLLAARLHAAEAAPGWMAGLWTGIDEGGVEMEELWTPVKGGSMLGLHRDVRSGQTVSFEFLRIEATADGVTYWASPKGRPATPFRMTESADRRAVFSNPELPYPTRVIYWMPSDGLLHARIEGTLNGRPASEEWSWTKAK